MVRLSAFALLLLCVVVPTSTPQPRLPKRSRSTEFACKLWSRAPGNHGLRARAPSDFARGSQSERWSLRTIGSCLHPAIFGTEPWPDDGKNFSIPTLADDLATFITSFNARPVHLVSWSFGGWLPCKRG